MEGEGREFITPEIERRQHRRATLVTQVRCETLDREDLFVTRDVSTGGAFISTKDPYPRGSEVSLSFRLTPVDPPITCRGNVLYSLKGVGMGVQFLEVSEEVYAALQTFVDEAA